MYSSLPNLQAEPFPSNFVDDTLFVTLPYRPAAAIRTRTWHHRILTPFTSSAQHNGRARMTRSNRRLIRPYVMNLQERKRYSVSTRMASAVKENASRIQHSLCTVLEVLQGEKAISVQKPLHTRLEDLDISKPQCVIIVLVTSSRLCMLTLRAKYSLLVS